MGLAGPKNRTRISNDPQNTTWANNTSRFGHRILSSQGWTPGSSLGAENAAHSEHYTAASHSHIRVLLKEDTLGLGAKRGSERAENFGLAALESVLGRLNGREADVKKEEERRLDIEKRGFVARKFGFMNFISGGFLVGDKIERKIKKEEEIQVKVEIKEEGTETDMGAIEEKKAKKRKRSGEEEDEPKLKRKKKSMNLRATIAEENEAEQASEKSKSKKDRKKSKKSSVSSSASPAPTSDPSEPLSDKAKRKAERAARRARKEEKRLKKALKKAAKEATSSPESEDEEETATSTTAPTTGTSTPTATGLTFGAGGRHAVRQRYIRQKKMASMDPQAMREIFMIKTPS
ncbi:hypothetical protein K505DRAFT_405632 [Melanomma pulvis-pyrius CBS 109.77]|uniref:PinX1-related protein 1 n=1 Tax=Melanomma pulvis-pyrius CBS 109.77 TaxID=1314802 RepID=A0A6A6XMB8_9PLEO|nr:hypothetical protein K505DRAFT_405632 [Melanomma pulvis-pyrius CBS 109.77]